MLYNEQSVNYIEITNRRFGEINWRFIIVKRRFIFVKRRFGFSGFARLCADNLNGCGQFFKKIGKMFCCFAERLYLCTRKKSRCS